MAAWRASGGGTRRSEAGPGGNPAGCGLGSAESDTGSRETAVGTLNFRGASAVSAGEIATFAGILGSSC
ncbi:MAG: hypothetical protein RLZZ436_1616 [Planctomycetota bacterium]